MFHVLVELVASAVIFDQPPVNVEGIWIWVIGRVAVDPPVVTQDGSSGRDEESFLSGAKAA